MRKSLATREMNKLSTHHYYLTLGVLLSALFGAGAIVTRTLEGLVVGCICLIAAIVLLIVRGSVKKKYKGEFAKSLSEVVSISLKENNILENGFRVMAKNKGLKYVVKVYDNLGSYIEGELATSIHQLVESSDMNVKVKIKKSNLKEMVADVFC